MNEVMSWFKESEVWASVDAVFTIVSIGITVWTLKTVYDNIRNNKRQLEKVKIFFNDKELNLDIARKDITRSEVQGILGILRKDMSKNYHIDFLTKIDYLDEIYKVQQNQEKLKIRITKKEVEQFKDDIYKA